jgi:hypothetical protein
MGRRTIRVAGQFLVSILTEGAHGWKVLRDAVPGDARVVDCRPISRYTVPTNHDFEITLESSHWDGFVGEICPLIGWVDVDRMATSEVTI